MVIPNPFVTQGKEQQIELPTKAKQEQSAPTDDLEKQNHATNTLEPHSDWKPPLVKNPFADPSTLNPKKRLRWGPRSHWGKLETIEQKEPVNHDELSVPEESADKTTDLAELLIFRSPTIPSQRPTTINTEEVDGEQNLALPGAGSPPHPIEWEKSQLKQPDWLSGPGEPAALPPITEATPLIGRSQTSEAMAVEELPVFPEALAERVQSDRWHAAESGPYDPFDEPTTAAVFVSDHEQQECQPEVERQPLKVAVTELPADRYQRLEEEAGAAQTMAQFQQISQECEVILSAGALESELEIKIRQLAAWARNCRGEMLAAQSELEAALNEYQAALRIDPSSWLALHNQAIALAEHGHLEPALDSFSKAIDMNPGLTMAFRNRAELLSSLGRTQEALHDYTAALSQQPNDPELYSLRGHARHRMRQYEFAMQDFNEALRLDSKSADAYTGRGNLQAELGNFEAALRDYKQALVVDKTWSEAYRSLAWLLATCPDQRYRSPRRAMLAAQGAARYGQPNDPFVLEALAAASASAQQFEAAAGFQRQALELVPTAMSGPMQHRLALYQQQRSFVSGQSQPILQASHAE